MVSYKELREKLDDCAKRLSYRRRAMRRLSRTLDKIERQAPVRHIQVVGKRFSTDMESDFMRMVNHNDREVLPYTLLDEPGYAPGCECHLMDQGSACFECSWGSA